MTFLDYIRSIFSAVIFIIAFLIGTPIAIILVAVTFGKATNAIVEYLGPAMAKPILRAAGIRFRVKNHGFDFSTPAVYIINHSSTLDLFSMIALGLPGIRYVAKWELQYNPLFFLIGRATGQVFIKRQERNEAVQTLQKAYRKIKRKKLSVMVAPEGSRKHEGIIGPFKKGAFRMAMDLSYPIVPIYFEGTQQLSEGGSLFTKSGTITAHIHPAISTAGWTPETLEENITKTRKLYLNWAGVEEPEKD